MKKQKQPRQPKPRELPVIQADYAKACSEVGELQHRIWVSQQDVVKLNHKLNDLHAEAFRAKAIAEQKAAAQAAKEAKKNKEKK